MAEPQHPMAGYSGKGNKKRTFSYHQKKSLRIKCLQSPEKVFPPEKVKNLLEKSFEKTLWGATLRMSSLCKARLHSKSQHMLFATCYIMVSFRVVFLRSHSYAVTKMKLWHVFNQLAWLQKVWLSHLPPTFLNLFLALELFNLC